MNKYWITEEAHEALRNHVTIGRNLLESPKRDGGRVVELGADVIARLEALQGPGESLSEVIIAVCRAPTLRNQ